MIIFAVVLFLSGQLFASQNLQNNATPQLIHETPESNSVCETRTSTINNEETGESISVSCTKCADTPEEAGIAAALCAYNSVMKIRMQIGN